MGIGIGGIVNKCDQIAKKSLLREVGIHNESSEIVALEKELLTKINNLGI